MNFRLIGLYIFSLLVIILICKSFFDSEMHKKEIHYEHVMSEEKRKISELKSEISSLYIKIKSLQNTELNSTKKIIKHPNGSKEITKTYSKNFSLSLNQEAVSSGQSNTFSLDESDKKNQFQSYNFKEEISKSVSKFNIFSGLYFPSIRNIKFSEIKIISGFLYQEKFLSYGSFTTFSPNQHDFGFALTAGLSF